MRQITNTEFAKAAQKLLKQVGRDRFDDAVELMLKDLVVVDAEGNPIDDVTVTVGEITKAMDDQTAIEDRISKAVSAAVEKAVGSGGDSSRTKAVAQAPAIVRKRYTKIKNFKGEGAEDQAYRFGCWIAAASGKRWALKRCEQLDIPVAKSADDVETKGHSEGVNSAGGFLVPEEFNNALIDLRLDYGVFRANANIVPMMRDVVRRPRKTTDLTAYFVGEKNAGTESTAGFDSITLTARKLMVLTTASNELVEDAAINIGDFVAGNIAYQFAKKEDDCGFNGTGTSTYGGIVGAVTNIGSAGVTTQASGTTWAAITLADCTKCIGSVHDSARNLAWYCHKAFWGQVLLRLTSASGGVTFTEAQDRRPMPMFMGFPVYFTNVLPATTAGTTVSAFFGDLAMAADFGDRRETSIAVSDSALNTFEQDEIAIRGSERFDINVHSVGDSSTAGPLVALKTG